MNTTFSYNRKGNYLLKDLKGGYNSINFLLLDIYLDEKGPSVKTQLLNIFKDHHIVAQISPTSVGYSEWPLSSSLWINFIIVMVKCKPELNEYFHIYQCQLSFAIFCATSALGISWQHLNHLYISCVFSYLINTA